MNIKRLFPILLLPVLVILGNGCVTPALWNKTSLEGFKEPADNPNLRLFQAKQQGKDFLVVYDEYSDRNDSTHTRAYWLYQNQKRIDDKRAPKFVSADRMKALTPVPVFPAANSPNAGAPQPFYAVFPAGTNQFTLFADSQLLGSYALPVYNDGKGQVTRIMLTPLAATADTALVAGTLGVLWFWSAAANGGWTP